MNVAKTLFARASLRVSSISNPNPYGICDYAMGIACDLFPFEGAELEVG